MMTSDGWYEERRAKDICVGDVVFVHLTLCKDTSLCIVKRTKIYGCSVDVDLIDSAGKLHLRNWARTSWIPIAYTSNNNV